MYRETTIRDLLKESRQPYFTTPLTSNLNTYVEGLCELGCSIPDNDFMAKIDHIMIEIIEDTDNVLFQLSTEKINLDTRVIDIKDIILEYIINKEV